MHRRVECLFSMTPLPDGGGCNDRRTEEPLRDGRSDGRLARDHLLRRDGLPRARVLHQSPAHLDTSISAA